MQSEIKNVALSSIDPNPMRMAKQYPFNEDKISALRRSIKEVGLWEGVLARKVGGRYEIAFGHHRVEAGRKELGRDGRVPVIVRDLTDEQMLQFMGRENLEDYNADFLVMLNAWEAATKFLADERRQNPQDIDVARLLGWIEPKRKDDTASNHTARACADATKLISGGYMEREQLAGLAVSAVRELCARVLAQHEMLERMARQTQRPAAEVERSKRASAKGGARAAKDVREGRIAQRDIRGAVDVHAYRASKEKKSPLFTMFAKSLSDQIERICQHDNIKEKFEQIKQALNVLTEDEDIEVVKMLSVRCEAAAGRFEKWQKTFSNPQRKVVKLKEISR